MKNSKGYIYYFFWIVGVLLLIYYGHEFKSMMEHKSGTFYKVDYSLLGQIIYALVFGFYLSLLNGLPHRRKFHRPLFLFVFVPSFLFLIYPVIVIYVDMIRVTRYFELVGHPEMFFFGLLSGLTLMKSLFGNR